MGKLLVLDWENSHLHAVCVTTGPRGLSWSGQLFSEPEPQAASVAEQGQRLGQRLRDARLYTRKALLIVPRSQVLVREVRHPEAPAAEEPALVHYQAAKEVVLPLDDALLDYSPMPLPGPLGERRSLVAVIRRSALTLWQQWAQAASLDLVAVVPRTHALAAAARLLGLTADRETIAVDAEGPSWREFLVMHGTQLIFSKSMPSEDSDSARLALTALEAHFPNLTLARVYCVTDARVPEWHRYGLPAQGIDRSRLGQAQGVSGNWAGFVPALGAAWSWTQRDLPVNFVAPKQPRPAINWRRRSAIAATVAAALALAGGMFWYYRERAARDQEIQTLQVRLNEVQKQIKALGDVDRRYRAVEDWAESEVVLLDELYDLLARLPGQAGVRITRLEISPLANAPRTAARSGSAAARPGPQRHMPIAEMKLQLTAPSAAMLDTMRRAIDEAPQWAVKVFSRHSDTSAEAVIHVYRHKPSDYRAVLQPPQLGPAPTSADQAEDSDF
ncbi:MAG: hypothetical protein C4297_07200 [Gemmataceae bacterium]